MSHVPKPAPATRLEWLDVAKGLSIILVVFGHVFPPPLGTSIAVVRMPFFFFLSGYIFRPRPWPDFLWLRGNSLIVPYLVYLISIVGVVWTASHWYPTGDRFIEQGPLVLLRELAKGGSHLDGYVGALWFLTTLFLTLAAYNWILLEAARRPTSEPSRSRVAAQVLVLLAVGIALSSHQLYLGLGIAPVALFFVWAGSAFHATTVPEWVRWPALVILIASVATGLALYPDYRFDMRLASYGVPIFSLIGSIAGCYILVLLCQMLTRVDGLREVLSSIGRNSIAIMALHLSVSIPAERLAHVPPPITFVMAIALPYLFALALRRGHWIPQWLFLGQPPRRPAFIEAWTLPRPTQSVAAPLPGHEGVGRLENERSCR